jgi:AAA+ ATPase superfamily predicted ATPase
MPPRHHLRGMHLPFLDRERELGRLARALDRPGDALLCLYGRRRCGKSRLVQELGRDRPLVYYVGDERDAPLQRAALAREAARLLERFAAVTYPDWEALLDRWWREAPAGAVLALDEVPALVQASPELPGLLQKFVDRRGDVARKTVLCGSSQRMMLGMLLDASAPLYGRAREIIKVEPLEAAWLAPALGLADPARIVEQYAVWGGVPRYWELAADYPTRREAVAELVLDPLGVLHREPDRLLLDDLQEVARAASILALIGQGCHRLSEIAARLDRPATSLTRPMARLLELGLVRRELPFGRSERDSKRTLYRIADPFLRFWYRFVEPDRSRLGAGLLDAVAREVEDRFPHHLGSVWEDLARAAVPRLGFGGRAWGPAARWWGAGADGPLELDLVATDGDDALVGEVKTTLRAEEIDRLLADLEARAARCPELRGKRVTATLWAIEAPRHERVIDAAAVLGPLPRLATRS